MRDKTRIEAMQGGMGGRLSVVRAATLNLSEQQVYRWLATVRGQSLTGLLHGNHGRRP